MKTQPIAVKTQLQPAAPPTCQTPPSVSGSRKDEHYEKKHITDDPLALTVALAACLQIATAIWQSFTFRQQATLANKTLIATFRPKLLVRSIVLEFGTTVSVAGSADRPWFIRYTIANVGGSPARVTHLLATTNLIADDALPPVPRYVDRSAQIDSFSLVPGQFREVVFEMPIADSNQIRFLRRAGEVSTSLYFLGYLRFNDDAEVSKSYGFCRKYNFNSGRFWKVDDPDYEFSD